ncbi:MAG: bile acid:sodium symporter [Veillonellales bacterium]
MLNKIHRWINQRMFLLVLLAMVLGYFYPLESTPFLQKTIMLLFAYMTLATALGTSFKEFLKVSRNPKIPLYVLSIVHLAVPTIAWVIGKIFFPDSPYIQMGYLISAMIPVGVTSIIWTSMVKGNVPVSLVTVTLDTILAPFFLPLFILLFVGVAVTINYSKMAIDLLFMITLPSLIGMILYDVTKGKTQTFAQGGGGILSKLCLGGVIFLNAAFVTPTITWSPFIFKILAVTLLIVAIGYIIGYVSSKLIHANHEITLAIIYNTGMRNIATGLVIASSYFPPEVAIPIALAMLFQQPLAAVTAKLYKKIFPDYLTEKNRL